MAKGNSSNAEQDEGSAVYAWLVKVQQTGTPAAQRAAQVLKDYYEGADSAAEDVSEAMATAREKAYPVPDSPHASVIERNSTSRIAYERGYRDRAANDGYPALAIPQGWKLVPEVLTDEMLVAFAEVWFSKVRCIDDCEMADCYAALLAIAPEPLVEVTVKYPSYLSEPHGAMEVAGYQMLASPKVFYEADWKPTDTNNFRTLFALREVGTTPPTARKSELCRQLEALAEAFEVKRRKPSGSMLLERVYYGMREGLKLAADLAGKLSSAVPQSQEYSVGAPLQLVLAPSVIDQLWREAMESAPAPAYRYFAQSAVSAAAAPAPLVNEDLSRLARKEALLVYESMPMGRADTVLVGYGRALLKAAGVNVEAAPAPKAPM